MTNPILVATAVEVGALASVGIGAKVYNKILARKIRPTGAVKKGQRVQRRVLGEVNDAIYVSEKVIEKADDYLNPFLKKGKKNQFHKSFDVFEKTQKKLTGKDFPDTSALRRFTRIESKLTGRKPLLDRPIKDFGRLLS